MSRAVNRALVTASLLASVASAGCGVGAAKAGKQAAVVPVAAVAAKPLPPPAPPCAVVADAELLDAADAFGKTVREICLRGIPDPELTATLLKYFRVRPGAVLTPEGLRREVASLYENGFLRRVDVTARPAGTGIELDFDLELRPKVTAFAIEGATSLSAEDSALRVSPVGSIFEPSSFRRNIEDLRERYAQVGFEDAKVERDVTPDGNDGVRIRVRVIEGARSKVGTVSIEGASTPLEVQIRKIPELVSGEPITATDLERARLRLMRLYGDRGYVNAVTRAERGERTAGGAVPIAITVREGAVYRVGKIRLALSNPALENEMRKQVHAKTGAPFVGSSLLADQWRIQDALRARGKDFTVRQEIKVDETTKTIDVVFEKTAN